MERITSRKNPLLEHMRRLDGAAYRRAQGEFLCDSPKLVEEALRHGAQVVSLAVSDGVTLPQGLAPDVRCVTVPKDVMTSVSSMRTPQGMLAVCRMPDTAPCRRCLPDSGMWCWTAYRIRVMWAR